MDSSEILFVAWEEKKEKGNRLAEIRFKIFFDTTNFVMDSRSQSFVGTQS